MSETVKAATTEDEQDMSVRTRYQVSWRWAGRPGKVRRSKPMVDSAQMTRPGDPEQRDQLIRLQLKNLLPSGQEPEAVILDSVEPICNCEPFPEPANCLYREHQGQRFHLTTSTAYAGCEVIHDRHGDKIVGIVSISESVMFLTRVREKYGHQ
ncbi:hypothetical protein ACIQVK_18765 [Streptomyces sp. NPDC090493]|uniref:hypothetical protein n=1 Tax=Streptomyces sp. NPDC090493 TaxID=3365964 RepID=UPI003810A784